MSLRDDIDADELLAQEDSWELRRCSIQGEPRLLNSYIVHTCIELVNESTNLLVTHAGIRFWWSLPIDTQTCSGCGKTPHPNIMCLWKLHNFEYIQAGK